MSSLVSNLFLLVLSGAPSESNLRGRLAGKDYKVANLNVQRKAPQLTGKISLPSGLCVGIGCSDEPGYLLVAGCVLQGGHIMKANDCNSVFKDVVFIFTVSASSDEIELWCT